MEIVIRKCIEYIQILKVLNNILLNNYWIIEEIKIFKSIQNRMKNGMKIKYINIQNIMNSCKNDVYNLNFVEFI